MRWFEKLSAKKAKMPTRPLGKTGKKVGILSLGGQGALEKNPDIDRCVKIILRARELGVNYFDTSPIYGPDRVSEVILGQALKDVRDDVILASKTHNRSYDASMRLLEGTLRSLRTDRLDVWQVHNLKSKDEVRQIFGKWGAMKALLRMQDEGVVDHLGITGHENPDVLLEAMRRHDFDTVLCPVNPAEKHVKPSFVSKLLPRAKRKRMGAIGMKVFSQGHIFDEDGILDPAEPLEHAMSQDVATVIVGIENMAELEQCVAIAKGFRRMTRKRQREVEGKTKGYLEKALFFRSKFGGYGSKEELDEPYLKQ
jgi:aryl-alcohol dehydrogenase-like predicted oxidoreductase